MICQIAVPANVCLEEESLVLHIAHLRQQYHDSKCVIFQDRLLKVLKCYNFLWVQQRQNCSPAASFANCVMTLHLLKVHLQTFLSIPITQKCQILSCDTLVANEQYVRAHFKTVKKKYCIVLQGTRNPFCGWLILIRNLWVPRWIYCAGAPLVKCKCLVVVWI